MARRKPSGEEPAGVFSVSFLDVFACTLGILLFIMLLVARQLTLTFDASALEASIREHEERQTEVAAVLDSLGRQKQTREALARINAEGGIDAVRQRAVEAAAKARRDAMALANGSTDTSPGALEELRRRKSALEKQLSLNRPRTRAEDTNRLSPSPFANLSPTPGTTVRPFVILVRTTDLVDLWNVRRIPASRAPQSAWRDLVNEFSGSKDSVYPVLLVEPDSAAVAMMERLVEDLRGASVEQFSIEPLSRAWRPSVDAVLRRLEGS